MLSGITGDWLCRTMLTWGCSGQSWCDVVVVRPTVRYERIYGSIYVRHDCCLVCTMVARESFVVSMFQASTWPFGGSDCLVFLVMVVPVRDTSGCPLVHL